ncbi:hypothetical protein L915_21686 [Phytophthora nicotianae]|uniref:Uncharacterized protein n=1 Tax=Phytophthora nicotianae TaxID=4792 RepID=W2FJS1_PHYNI|nr:hypothetical protein L915_21686 [Phytophthora nicotianae]
MRSYEESNTEPSDEELTFAEAAAFQTLIFQPLSRAT